MKEAGADGLYFGVESGSDRILKKISKRFNVAKAMESIQQAKEHIPHIIASFIWGFPFENQDDFLDTLLVYGHCIKEDIACQLHLLSPMFHSTLFKQFAHTLSFSKELISDIVLTRYGIDSFCDYILEYPDIFVSFWHYWSEDMDQKVQILKKMKISHFDQRFEKTISIDK